MILEKFKINKLHNSRIIELSLDNNTLILLGENGSCKTTIIKMMFYTLSMQWRKLCQYNFENIEVRIDGKDYIFYRNEFQESILNNSNLNILPIGIRKRILAMIERNNGNVNLDELDFICKRYNIPLDFILDYVNNNHASKFKKKNLHKKFENFRESLKDVHFLYLPTYRRIEQELKVVLEGMLDEDEYMDYHRKRVDDSKNYSELIEFGMNDVYESIENVLTSLKESSRANLNQLTLSYLSDIVNEEYYTINPYDIRDIDEETIHKIMNRVDSNILSDSSKEKLLSTLKSVKERAQWDDHDKVVCHYFFKLYESQKVLEEKETVLTNFFEVCNNYFTNKAFYYDSPNFMSSIKSHDDGHPIELRQLSSGEKQIVSLFSHLYLSSNKKFFVLIDEPELSLSVRWQKTFLEDIRKGNFCSGLVAVTHSPFVFNNSLDWYAHGLEEFLL